MLSLTKLWGDFKNISCENSDFIVTSRMFLKKLDDPDGGKAPLFVGVNTLSGAIDIFSCEEGRILEELTSRAADESPSSAVPEAFFLRLRDRGYIFPSREIEDLVFDTLIHRYKTRKYNHDRILAFFSIDTGCSMKCEYCFEKNTRGRSEAFENSVMTPDSLEAAFKTLDFIRDLQEKEVEFAAGWGGEPLQEKHQEVNERFVALAKERGLPIVYFSNLAMTGRRLLALLEENSAHIKFLSTTLDATQTVHDGFRGMPGAFKRTVESIDTCLRMGLPVVVRTNVGPHNMDCLVELAAFYDSRKWFDLPNFKAFIAPTHDRQHDQDKNYSFSEEEAMVRWLRLRDEFPLLGKLFSLKYAPSLNYIVRAFEPRGVIDLRDNEREVTMDPMVTHCMAENRTEYVFTGAPHHSVYICAECTGLSKYRIGSYHPRLSFDPEKKKMWGIQDDFHAMRSVDRLEECRSCRAATLCGGYCALEAIVEHGRSDRVFCRQAYDSITKFLDIESARLYRTGRALVESTGNLAVELVPEKELEVTFRQRRLHEKLDEALGRVPEHSVR